MTFMQNSEAAWQVILQTATRNTDDFFRNQGQWLFVILFGLLAVVIILPFVMRSRQTRH
jgi:hypothetical protein